MACRELNPVVPRAISHDSIFTPEELPKEAVLDQTMSQENVSDKVRNLQVLQPYGASAESSQGDSPCGDHAYRN
uniref:Uncharacterized protein n=1 Tax=Gadus morhua TaxID=8049 RepID=A0A8C5AZ86_GADMO